MDIDLLVDYNLMIADRFFNKYMVRSKDICVSHAKPFSFHLLYRLTSIKSFFWLASVP